MKTSMSDIASLAGVSMSTVSKILNGNDQHISEATRKKVLELVARYEYTPNYIAKSLKTSKTKTIGFIQPDICNPFFAELSKGIDDEAWASGYSVLHSNTSGRSETEVESFRTLAGKMVDGIVFIRGDSMSRISRSLTGGIPLVLADRFVETDVPAGRVYANVADGICHMTRHLLASGCRRLVFISGGTGASDERYEGFVRAHSDSGTAFYSELILSGTYDIKSGYTKVLELLNAGATFDGIVCGNDLIALGAVKALAEKKIPVPRSVKVTGCDDIFFAEYTYPPLTTVRQPIYQIGRECARMLIAHLENGAPLGVKELPYEIVIRESA